MTTRVELDNGEITLNAATSSTAADFFLYSLHAPNKDIDVEMELYGGKGTDISSTNVGGEGGFSRIRFTMTQNTEYVIAGLTNSINTPFVYSRASLIACVGGGGNAGTGGSGGSGGGIGVPGSTGLGAAAGTGANTIIGGLGSHGTFGSSFQSPILYPHDSQAIDNNGGKTINCPKGVYWAQQTIAPCADISGSTKFRLSDGTEITNTADITRGYKAGYNIIQTAGAGNNNGGNGGNGVVGGDGGGFNSGGGGASGYTDGSVTVVSTQQGGSTGNAKIIIRLQT